MATAHLPTREKVPSQDAVQLAADAVMRALVRRYGAIDLKTRPPFAVLSRSIIAQQISTKAADTIRQRFVKRFGPGSKKAANARLASLREVGLSESKARAIQRVAMLSEAGELAELRDFQDEDILRILCCIPGVGPWTGQMFLIFALARPDIWPTTDAGLRVAAQRLYKIQCKTEIQQLGDRFRPRRSLAALFLWKSLENTTED